MRAERDHFTCRSSDLGELLTPSERVVVLCTGVVTGELDAVTAAP
ncbi:hypothetical protein [Nocardia carnea]|nr:hypothetical protein [Nocardia carnea]